jgi:hypothetical protein
MKYMAQITQISLVIKLVIVQQALLTQISLVINGYNATNAYNSNFFGYQAGNSATSVFGVQIYLEPITGDGAKNAYYSNFMGEMLVEKR